MLLLVLALAGGLLAAWFTLAPPGLSPAAAWQAWNERTPSQWIRYAMRRLEGHTRLEWVALPVLQAAQRQHERPVPDGLPDLGKGQRPWGLTAQRFSPAGLPQAATALSQATRPPLADRQVHSMEALAEAVLQAQAGEVIEVAPGTYAWPHTLRTRTGGAAGAPIVLRAQRPGTVTFEVSALEGLVVRHPYWVIENLNWRGVCRVHNDCEHALHVVGAAIGTVLRNNHLSDFNAHVKVNGEGGRWPDGGLLQFNTLTNTAPRGVVNRPVTPFDLVGASAWVLRDNLVTDFVRPDLKSPAYGLFMKGGGENGRIEHNLVICTRGNISQFGTRVGISLGGGLTGGASARPGPDFTFEHRGGVVRNNVVAHCNEAGLDSNRAIESVFADNILVNTSGVLLRGGSQVRVERNLLDGGITLRDTSSAQASENVVGDTRDLFEDADRLQLQRR